MRPNTDCLAGERASRFYGGFASLAEGVTEMSFGVRFVWSGPSGAGRFS